MKMSRGNPQHMLGSHNRTVWLNSNDTYEGNSSLYVCTFPCNRLMDLRHKKILTFREYKWVLYTKKNAATRQPISEPLHTCPNSTVLATAVLSQERLTI